MRPLRGILLKLLSVTIFLVMSSCIKSVSDHVPTGEVVFFRSGFAMPVILAWLGLRGDLGTGLRTAIPLGHALRGIMGTMGMASGFAGLALLPLPEVTALGYASPLLTVVFAALLLGERVRLFRLSAVALGLCGVLVVLMPRLTAFSGGGADRIEAIGALIVLGGAVFSALAQIQVRRLVATERISAIVFYFFVTATTLSLLTLPFGWVWPTAAEAALLISAGIAGGLGQILLTAAYREADASLVAPFEYASMVLAILVGYVVFTETPDTATLSGGGVIVVAGLLILWRERQLGLERARQRRASTPT